MRSPGSASSRHAARARTGAATPVLPTWASNGTRGVTLSLRPRLRSTGPASRRSGAYTAARRTPSGGTPVSVNSRRAASAMRRSYPYARTKVGSPCSGKRASANRQTSENSCVWDVARSRRAITPGGRAVTPDGLEVAARWGDPDVGGGNQRLARRARPDGVERQPNPGRAGPEAPTQIGDPHGSPAIKDGCDDRGRGFLRVGR